jgi:hypothetical protein
MAQYRYAERLYAECPISPLFAECRYAECRGALRTWLYVLATVGHFTLVKYLRARPGAYP